VVGNVTDFTAAEYVVDAHGGGVIEIESITLLRGDDAFRRAGRLTINCDPGDNVVINVLRQLSVSLDAYVTAACPALLNVVGKGSAVTVADGGALYMPLLAPGRTVRLAGKGSGLGGATARTVWEKTVRFDNLVFTGQ